MVADWRNGGPRASLAGELEARSQLPAFEGLAVFSPTHWKAALKPLGFDFEVIEASSGALDRQRMRRGSLILIAEAIGSTLRLQEVVVEWAPTSARARVEDGAMRVLGSWSAVPETERELLGKAVETLGGAAPDDHRPRPADRWVLGMRLSQGRKRKARCGICRRKLESFVNVGVYWAPDAPPALGTSAWTARRADR